jgi:hypothetical protein
MPVKKMNGGTAVNVNEVIEIAEMLRLAQEWARTPHLFDSENLERYRELCARYGMDSSVLLYSVQNAEQPAASEADSREASEIMGRMMPSL